MKENIIISDVHGCRREFNQLLDKLNYDSQKHRVILVGDLIDRGPDPVGLVQQVQRMQLEVSRGNHEDKALNWRKAELRRKLTGEKNTAKPPSNTKTREEWEAFTNQDLDWLDNLPYSVHIKENWFCIHAGLESCNSFTKQNLEKMIRVRYLNKYGQAVNLKVDKSQPADTKFWAEMWEGKESIVFGHFGVKEPTYFKNKNNTCIALDTRCVYGGYLTAYNLERDEFIQIKAAKVYYQPKKS